MRSNVGVMKRSSKKLKSIRTGKTRYNVGDDVIYKKKKTYVKEVLGIGKPVLYLLPKNIVVTGNKLRKIK